MLLSIIGNILGNDGESDSNAGNGDGSLDTGELAGSMSQEELMPGVSTGDGLSSDGSGSEMGDADLFGDDGGTDDLLGDDGEMADDGGMSIDGMGEMDDDDRVSSEIESRVEDMENEVGSLASTVNTVQSENENISGSLDEIEENIRKLLEVYEMVTQGVNPFVEDDSLNDTFGGPGGGAQGTGNFGGGSLFDADGDDEDDNAVDDDIAAAEAEDFLDESVIDDDDDEFGFDDDDDELDDAGGEFDDGDDEFDDAGATDGDDGDLSFDELKSEYDSGDADWDGDESDTSDGDLENGSDDASGDDDAFGDDSDDPLQELDDEATAPIDDELDGGDSGSRLGDADTALDSDDALDRTDQSPLDGPEIPWDDGNRPYLESVPSEYDTEFVVMDWLDHLVAEVGLDGASRTIRFYGSIHWISDGVEEYLRTILNGFDGGPEIDDPEPLSSLGVDHARSLWWIQQIGTPSKKRCSFDEWLDAERPSLASQSSPVTLDADGANDTAGTERIDFEEYDPDTASSDSDLTVETSSEATRDDESVIHEFDEENLDDDEQGRTWAEDAIETDFEEPDRGVRTIHIEEDTIEAVPTDDEPADGPPLSDRNEKRDDERMIWVDSDVILSEPGLEIAGIPDVHRNGTEVEYAQPTPETGRGSGSSQPREPSTKPLVASEEESDLERWQIELIRSLLTSEDESRTV
ncbi:flagella accessory C family protein [Natrarchaeobius halalkaliphilus]|uniref:Flagella accessory C family protein n=1 Tax=Natrarchaeobius halalkaliphilus TaxID=1679091 RepID=A0A3N6M3P6_9EURY|nr:FlaD/FlaE family flagellar protein [Natrarchaeobius halalkaliphilus]RQG86747.1 flagella accessory C family protein [Natrarchaeobius halalkaliphilus]